ncbi:MAG: toxin-antitoxin system YwqK family antitoxin [Bacteroidota bacterium]
MKTLFALFACILFSLACNTFTAPELENANITDTSLVYRQDTLSRNNKLFTGCIFALHTNGDTALLKSFKGGVEHGITKIWYPNGRLAEERDFENGKKVGLHKGWWPNGNKKFRYSFKNGEFDGEAKEWYESGSIFKEFHYEKGYEQGSQKLWWINGKTRVNYVIKNNRRYGLLGTKNCVNVADSIVSLR